MMENPGNWNSEEKRLERKKRLESLKSKEGTKPPVETSGKFSRLVKPIIIIVLVLAIGLWAAIQFALPQRIFPPMTINGQKVSSVEFSFYYSNTLAQLGIDPTTAEGKQILSSPAAEEGYEDKTWKDFAIDRTAKTVVEFQAQYDLANENDIELTQDELDEIKTIFDGLIEQMGGKSQADAYLVETFGKNVTVDNLIPVFEKSTLASKYAEQAIENIELSDDQVFEYYESRKNLYDTVALRLEFFEIPKADEDATDDEKESLSEQTQEEAKDFIEQISNEDEFKTLSDERAEKLEEENYENLSEEEKEEFDEKKQDEEEAEQEKLDTMTEEEKEMYLAAQDNMDYSLIPSIKKQDITQASALMADWLFEEDREPGDTEVFSSAGGYYAVYFVERNEQLTLPSARHILISPNEEKNIAQGATFTEKEWADARKTAIELLDEIGTSKDKFIEMVEEHSADPGSLASDGLYENIEKMQMMPEFDNWVFDESRQVGDTGIVRTDYGFHIMWFEGSNELTAFEKNEDAIRTLMAQEKYLENLAELIDQDEYSFKINSFGLGLII